MFLFEVNHRHSQNHIPDSHRDQFRTALMKNEATHLNIRLCYEASHACVGVKRKTFQVSISYLKIDIAI